MISLPSYIFMEYQLHVGMKADLSFKMRYFWPMKSFRRPRFLRKTNCFFKISDAIHPSNHQLTLVTTLMDRVLGGIRCFAEFGTFFAIPLATHLLIFMKKSAWKFLEEIVKLSIVGIKRKSNFQMSNIHQIC